MEYTIQSPLPRLRRDIDVYEVAPGYLVLYDEVGYAEQQVPISIDLFKLLRLLNGRRSAEELAAQAARAGRPFSVQSFLESVIKLDSAHYMESPAFEARKEAYDREYNQLTVRPAVHAGISYPSDPAELRETLDEFLQTGWDLPPDAPAAVVAPHIDFRVGGSSYGPAYSALKHSDADTFVIFGVAHHMSYDSFMISEKDFATPLGTVPTDRELIARFRSKLPFQLTRSEAAHRNEHSIEFQAVFLRHIFPDRQIRIVPILTGSLYEYVESGTGNAAADSRLTALYETLEQTAGELGRTVCYIAGADLCHIGRKFGDEIPARSILGDVRSFDMKAIASAVTPDAEGFIRTIADERNRYRVCGVAPIYATLRTAKPTRGELLCYDQWDEVERESAVTFASMVFYR
jgi:AmmeMemoRadiSam system protein B